MIISSLVAVAAATSKWLLAGKVMTVVGSGLITASPAIEQIRKGRRR